MQNDAQPIRAPQGALAWTPAEGYLYERSEIAVHVAAGSMVLVVSDDGYLRGVTERDRAPLAALLRLEGDLTEVVRRLDDLGEAVAGFDAGVAVDLSALKGRVRRLEERSR